MPSIDRATAESIAVALGYPDAPQFTMSVIQSGDKVNAVILRVRDLLDALDEIDLKMSAATQDSMAVQVGELTLSYAQHVNHLKSEGSRLLNELAVAAGVPIEYNRYRPHQKSRQTGVYW
jgi:hypothetical protein